MDTSPVVIVGAGPAGLVLALSLARYEIHSVLLEKETEIDEDPRGVFLAGDAIRVLYQIGIGDQMAVIGKEMKALNFHRTTWQNPPFFSLDLQPDWLEQTVAGGIFQVQPELEKALRNAIDMSPFCEFRRGCLVVSLKELVDGVLVEYVDQQEAMGRIKASWLVGADGKTGIVRKKFLEPIANIRQAVGIAAYTSTWVAANLQITLPTPTSHPDLPFWSMGLTPQEVYDHFWPDNWHFCSPPGKAVATGRFGPAESRLWRHEFAEPDWNESKVAEELLWENLTPMITRSSDANGQPFPGGAVEFPRDCVNILRCRPFTFCQKVVNKWFHNKSILIGDAAHVFPPFGGQGISCGIRDGDSLAWRLAIILRHSDTRKSVSNKILRTWELERRQGVDNSTRLTMGNGALCNKPESWGFFFSKKIASLLSNLIGMPSIAYLPLKRENIGYKDVKDGFFLARYQGGGKLAQVYVKTQHSSPILSDTLLQHGPSAMTLLVFEDNGGIVAKAKSLLNTVTVPTSLLSEESIVSISSEKNDTRAGVYHLCAQETLSGLPFKAGYDEKAFLKRFPNTTKYAIVRPDLIIFATA
ncbi:hypothetical protein B0O99DRAFT_459116, partial [Bisporella sp. PMI_857]